MNRVSNDVEYSMFAIAIVVSVSPSNVLEVRA